MLPAGPAGADLLLSTGNAGQILVATNTMAAAGQYGVYIGTQTSGASIWVTSNTILPQASNVRNTYGVYLSVNQDGTVHEKDLGPGTDAAARKMTVYNPDSSWRQVR